MVKNIVPSLGAKHRWLAITFAALIIYSLLPMPGEVLIVPDGWRESNAWPRIRLEPDVPKAGQPVSIVIADVSPWPHVMLTANGTPIEIDNYRELIGYWEWRWSLTMPDPPVLALAFYHNCSEGCIEWAKANIGATDSVNSTTDNNSVPTKLGIVFAQSSRDWHNRRGWDVELTYAKKADTEYWGIDDLAIRVQDAANKGLRVLVRVDFDQGQAIPPTDDYLALTTYLEYARRLARDDRLQAVYGYVIGSGYNSRSSNSQSPDHLVTPEWYARVFNGYNADPLHSDNVIETIHAENPTVRVLVGPVRPWIDDQNGSEAYRINQSWLNYMNSVVHFINTSAEVKAIKGIPLSAPDGFAVQAPGRPGASSIKPVHAAEEPLIDLHIPEWGEAQAGFRVYRDWLNIINSYPQTRGLPVYITSTNTYDPVQDVKPAQNYPKGWLTSALMEINREPQIQALCWFLDSFPMDKQWETFSLTNPQGLLTDAADEFDSLLKLQP